MAEDSERIILDRMETADVAHRYATAIDTKDWKLLRTVFASELVADFRSFGVRDVYRGSAEDWVAIVRSTIDGMDATQHFMANHVHHFDGSDRCTLTSYMRAEHFLTNDRGDDHYTIGGFYTWELARSPQGWKVGSYTLHVTWARGNRHLLALAARQAKRTR